MLKRLEIKEGKNLEVKNYRLLSVKIETSLWEKEKVSGADVELWNNFKFISLIMRIPKLALATGQGYVFMSKVRNPTGKKMAIQDRGGTTTSHSPQESF